MTGEDEDRPTPKKAIEGNASPGSDADRFGHVREARAAALLEDYTELIAELTAEHGEARITDIAARLGVTHPTANKAVARLKREGLAVSRPYRGVFLTEAGETMAREVKARHRLVVRLLIAVGVPVAAAEMDAEGIEHYVSPETLAAFEAFLEKQAADNSRSN